MREEASRQEAGVPKQLARAGVTEKLGQTVDLQSAVFRDENNQLVRLSQYTASGRPILLNLGYFGCSSLCGFVFNGMLEGLKGLEWQPGKQFEIVSLSIDPREGPELAAGKKKSALEAYGRDGGAGWHFLTGQEKQIRAIADAVGFGYEWDPKSEQYAHSAVLVALTPDGRVSRYLYGIQYTANNLKLAMLEAANGKIGTVIERILLFCYRYDPMSGKYSLALSRVMQAGGGVTLVLFGGYLAMFWGRQRRRSTSKDSSDSSPGKGA